MAMHSRYAVAVLALMGWFIAYPITVRTPDITRTDQLEIFRTKRDCEKARAERRIKIGACRSANNLQPHIDGPFRLIGSEGG
jgi:hypothetical protein